jgi:hypothetical protein
MRDELNKLKRRKNECMIINLDSEDNPGTHWTALYIEEGKANYFDSYGMPPMQETAKYIQGLPLDCNSFSIQKPGFVICGHYCIYVLSRLSNGADFYDVLLELL